MDCSSGTDIDRIICAIDAANAGIGPGAWWWWLDVLIWPLLASLIPVLVAIAVARHGRKTTLDAVEKQIEEARTAANRTVLRDRISEAIAAAERQMITFDWDRQAIHTELNLMSDAISRVSTALPTDKRYEMMDWTQNIIPDLVRIRTQGIDGVDVSRKTTRWVARTRWGLEMLDDGHSVVEILQSIDALETHWNQTSSEPSAT